MASLRNCFRLDKSAFGNRDCMASRAVLLKQRTVVSHHRSEYIILKHLLLRNCHEILRAQIISQGIS